MTEVTVIMSHVELLPMIGRGQSFTAQVACRNRTGCVCADCKVQVPPYLHAINCFRRAEEGRRDAARL